MGTVFDSSVRALARKSVAIVLGFLMLAGAANASWIMETIAGEPGVSDPTQGGIGSATTVVGDADGNLYISGGASAPFVFRLSSAGSLSTFAGTGNTNYNFSGSPMNALTVNMRPAGLAVGPNGDLFVADRANSVVYRITPAGVVAEQAAGIAGDTSGTGGSIGDPTSLALDADGHLFVGSTGIRLAVYRVDANTGTVTRFAGNLSGTFNGLSGDADAIALSGSDVAFDEAGNLLIADGLNYLVRRVTPAGHLTTIGGVPGDNSGSGDALGSVLAVAPDGEGGVFASGGSTGEIYRVDSGGTKSVFAGSGSMTPYNGDGDAGDPLTANFASTGLYFDGESLFIADAVHRLVRRVDAANTPPSDLDLELSAPEVAEGTQFTLSGTFVDPDGDDTHTLFVDWDDGEPEEEIALSVGARAFGPLTRTAPAGPAVLTIGVRVVDAADEEVSDTVSLTVLDVTPPSVSLAADASAQVGLPVQGTYTATDDGSGVASVQLYVRPPNAAWQLAGSASDGDWSFDNTEALALESGAFGFFLSAEDNAGNASPLPDVATDPMAETVVNLVENGAITLAVPTGTDVEVFFPLHGNKGVTLFFHEVTAAGTVTVSRDPASALPPSLSGLTAAGESWTIEASSGLLFDPTAGVDVRFDYDPDALGGIDATELHAAWSVDSEENATEWPLTIDETEETATALGVTSLSDWYLATEATSVPDWRVLE